MPRCESCNKMVSLEQNDPEVDQVEVDDDATVRAQIRIVNACADCGADLKSAELEAESDDACEDWETHLQTAIDEGIDAKQTEAIDAWIAEQRTELSQPDWSPTDEERGTFVEEWREEHVEEIEREIRDDHTPEYDEGDAERTERTEGTSRRAPKFYGAKVAVTVRCTARNCAFQHELEVSEEIQASGMDDC